MKQEPILYRLQYLFLPVILLATGFTAIYSLLNWFLVARSDFLPIDEDVVDLWLPVGLSALLIVTLIRPRLRVLKLDPKRNIPFLYNFAAIAVVAVPAIVAQGYVRTATGEETHVARAALIATSPETKYYTSDAICLVRDKAVFRPFAEVVGKQSETLRFELDILVPVCAESSMGGGNLPIWFGLKFQKSISNSLDEGRKQAAYQDFMNQSEASFRAENPEKYSYLERAGRNSDRRNFELALHERGLGLSSPQIILRPHLEPFGERTGQRLPWIFYSAGIAAVVWLVIVLVPPLDLRKPRAARRAAGRVRPTFLTMFVIPQKEAYGLQVLLLLNVMVFLAMLFSGLGVISFQPGDLISWGANYRPAIHGFGVFRLITSQFVHGGLMHLANNLYGLLFAGVLIGPVVRNGRLIFCYVTTGLGGSIASVIVHPATVSVGASGAILGLWGILLALVLLRDSRIVGLQNLILVNAAVFVGLTLAVGAVGHGIDNAAHIGGLLTGALLGAVIFFHDRYRGAAQTKLSA
jgi:membrane associated rhomboid family serine protease